MNPQTYESSGYLIDGFEGIDHHFTNIEIIKNTEYNILAKAKRYGRWWMLKAIRAEEDKQTVFQQMLRKELEILMQMQHPNIVQATGMEYVETLGMCIVMEYVDGIQLDEWINSPKSKENRFRLAEELLKAVEYIHTSGTVHRDLKPSNIMVTRNGENIKLIDFGLADNDHIAILKQPAGTPKYMSPEQAANSIPDIRNDIYSLGIILQQLLPEKHSSL
jgi:serine/threonine protein kinase